MFVLMAFFIFIQRRTWKKRVIFLHGKTKRKVGIILENHFVFVIPHFQSIFKKSKKQKEISKNMFSAAHFIHLRAYFIILTIFIYLISFYKKKKSMGETQQGKKKTKINFNYKLKERKTLGSLEGCPKTNHTESQVCWAGTKHFSAL